MNPSHPERSPRSVEVERTIVVDIIRHLLLRSSGSRGADAEGYLELVSRVRADLDATLGGEYGAQLSIFDPRFDITVDTDAHGTTLRVRELQPRAESPALAVSDPAFVQVSRTEDGTTVLRILRSDDLTGGPEDIRALVDQLFPA